ncbi:MAG TPA: FAD-binding oxidoreductase [Stellaceae bacterium]|jgi:FAD/FMN-containing dehydrogenase|nr:FAD-binding oxidoreductase [Stellaceae bacterium]
MDTIAPADAVARIKSVVGPKGVVEPADAEPYFEERRGRYHGAAMAVLRPASTDEVAKLVAICAEARLPIYPQGGNTGLSGGAVAAKNGVLINLGRMNRIRALDALNFTITAEAGCILAELQRAAEAADRLFPLSLGAEGSCQIGGNLSTNAGGINVLRYGNTRELALGLEVVLPDGRVWNGLRGLRKSNTGYDLKQLFIGAEGTLGIITAATLKLFPRPREIETALLGLKRVEDVMELFARARTATGDQLTGFELIPRIGIDNVLQYGEGFREPLTAKHPWYALLEISSSRSGAQLRQALEVLLEAAMAADLIEDGVIAESEAQRRELWRIRAALAEQQDKLGGSIKHDVSVPISKVAEFIVRASKAVSERLPGIRPYPFGHVGDGNIHFNLTQPPGADRAVYLKRWAEFNRIVHDIVVSLGGSISAEHGIGLVRRDELAHYAEPLEIETMRRVKAALDPDGILNPGKVI